ncbi:serine hydrolase domain-containing protein [Ekhidna sp. To15]|uniref:serine hydrolase domain-containing protein n=1 Tax=Ekhidna sp. To15 TaxID=3395267 RepID=UPI003F51D4C8
MKRIFFSLGFLLMAMGIISFLVRPKETQPSVILQQVDYESLLEQFELTSRMDYYGVPGISLAVIRDGKLDWAKGYGWLQAGGTEKVNAQTLFSVGSISKVGAAVLSLKLHEEGKLDIDEDVNQYLKLWKIEENDYTKDQAVTLRHIMSHTAGLTVHGFADFNPGEPQPTTVQILNGEWPAKNYPVV